MNYTNLYDIEACTDISIFQNHKIIIWGAGEKGKEISDLLSSTHLNISAFCDSEPTKWGTYFENKQILSPWNIKEKYANDNLCFILCTAVKSQRLILSFLYDLNFTNFKALTYWGIKNIFYIHHKSIFVNTDTQAAYIAKLKDSEILLNKLCIATWKLALHSYLDENSICLLQPGKVASTTIYESLCGNNFTVYQQHILAYNQHMFKGYLKDEWNYILNNIHKKKFKIITGVREPISRDYSAFWQPFSEDRNTAYVLDSVLDSNFNTMYQNYLELIMKNNADEILKNKKIIVWHDEFEWFNTHIKEVFGINIYDYKFDKELGYTIIKQDNCEIFLFKVEMLNTIMPEIFKFANMPADSPIKNANVANEKWYALAYESFKKNLKIPQEYVDHYYKNNKYVDHFYTEAEKENFISKWSKHIY